MKKIWIMVVLAIGMIIAQPSQAADDWHSVVKFNTNGEVFVQRRSGHFTTNDAGEQVYVANFKTRTNSGEISYSRKYVKEKYCANEFGEITTVTMTGVYLISTDFNLAGEQVVDFIAGALCSAIKANRENEQKSHENMKSPAKASV